MKTEVRKLTVITADDYPDMHPLIRRLLEPEFEVVADVFDGQALVETALRLKPDLLIVDVFMPILGGIEAVRRLKAQSSHALIVFISAGEERENIQLAFKSGALGYVQKASAAEDLLPAVQAVLRGQRFISGRGIES